jgi:hypothetical protein
MDIMKLLTMHFSPGSSYFLPLMSEYPPQHTVLENTHPVFFPSSERLFSYRSSSQLFNFVTHYS